jgi:hypothetical protein
MNPATSTEIGRPTDDTDTGPTTRAERFVERHRRTIEVFTQVGWLAKGTVYVLFGITAVAIARQSAPTDEASPKGALGKLMEAPAGRLLMAVMAAGLLLYSLWRAASVVLIDGDDAHAWGDRIGYSFSALFYVVLGITAARSAWSGSGPDDSNTVEDLSRTMLESDVGRWALGIAGLVTIAVGLYFTVAKGVMRRFASDVRDVTADGGTTGVGTALWVSGIAGWIGRGVVTVLVGYFVVRSAVTFDPDEARGFDRALREAATTTIGSVLVWVSAIGLIAYGAFCLASYRHRSLGSR